MPIGTKLRHEVFRRDLWTCQYCGRKAPDVILYVDHEIPRSRGGKDVKHNLVTSCEACNLGKADRPIFRCTTGLPLNVRESAAFLLGLCVGSNGRRDTLLFDAFQVLARKPDRLDEDRLRVQASRFLYAWMTCVANGESEDAAKLRVQLKQRAAEMNVISLVPSQGERGGAGKREAS